MEEKNLSKPLKHFHAHVVPRYKKSTGYCWSVWKEGFPTPEKYQQIKEKLQTRDGILGEKSKVLSELVPLERCLGEAHTIIKPKNPIPAEDINQVDQETWNQVGELLQESIRLLKNKLVGNSEEYGYQIHIPLGKMTGPGQETIEGGFQVHIQMNLPDTPPGVWKRNPQRVAEYQRTFKRLLDPNNPEYRRKKNTHLEERDKTDWKPWIWGGAIGFVGGAMMVGILTYLISRKKSRNKL